MYDSALHAAQLIAEEPLTGCDRTIEPVQEGQGGCIVCNEPPAGRLVLRREGEEIAWVSVCGEDSDTSLEVTATIWRHGVVNTTLAKTL
jgi:hypothetical protein